MGYGDDENKSPKTLFKKDTDYDKTLSICIKKNQKLTVDLIE